MNMVVPAAPVIGAVLPNGLLVGSRITGMILRAKMMSLAGCGTQSRSFDVDIGCRASKRAMRASSSSRLGVRISGLIVVLPARTCDPNFAPWARRAVRKYGTLGFDRLLR